jgi:uncharacterized protein (TIGR01777 family)
VVEWDGRSALSPTVFDGVGAVVHLAGEPVANGRLTKAKKARVRDSRVLGTRAIVASLRALPRPPSVLVSASAVGIYGDRGDQLLTESSELGQGFLADVCRTWEHEALAAEPLGVRVIALRIGVVLSPCGGALARMLPLFRLGLGGRLGSGRQWMPWIHVDDVAGLILHAVERDGVRGPVNAVGPNPVTNAEFTAILGRLLGRPTRFAAPEPLLRLALGEAAYAVIASQRAVPNRALAEGYRFRFETAERALADVVLDDRRRAPGG